MIYHPDLDLERHAARELRCLEKVIPIQPIWLTKLVCSYLT